MESQVALLYATPNDGWTMAIEHEGSTVLEVKYRSRTAESDIEVRCVGGEPTARVEAQGDASSESQETDDDDQRRETKHERSSDDEAP
jgi:hypothetical protein